ncbi:MAG: response regulator [Abitibacteriaceae bacterium]|nr:response regulator [Abditibacteriaceae bacterium]
MNETINVLLTEDNPADALLLREELSDAQTPHFVITHVERLQQALEHLASHQVDVVLLDLSLPDGHGLENVARLHTAFACVPIVVLTGNSDHELALQAVESGAQDYLIKGQADCNVLVRSIKYAIQRAEVLQALQQAHNELELRVQERTAELARINEELRAEIVARQQVEESLQRAKTEVEKASQAKNEFYSRMSHELRTPLNAILGFGQLLEMDSLNAKQHQNVGHIMLAGHKLLSLVNQLLQIAELETTDTIDLPDVLKPVNQAAFIAEMGRDSSSKLK